MNRHARRANASDLRRSRGELSQRNRNATLETARRLISLGYAVEVPVPGARSVVHLTEKGAAELAKKDPELAARILEGMRAPTATTDLRKGQLPE